MEYLQRSWSWRGNKLHQRWGTGQRLCYGQGLREPIAVLLERRGALNIRGGIVYRRLNHGCYIVHTDSQGIWALYRVGLTQNFGWVGHNGYSPANNWPVCSLILGKISKIGATRCHILRPKCAKFAFCWGSAPDSADRAYSAPLPVSVLKEPNFKGREGKGEKER